MDDPLNNFHIVLVEPSESLNIGSVARAMMNLGFCNLRLVAPPDFNSKKAAATARSANSLVEKAQFFDNLSAALADMQDVIGFSARHGKDRAEHLTLPQWTEVLAHEAKKEIALVFGPEDTGLRTEHVCLCRKLVRIPSSNQYSSFNLAQAALIAMFEISKLYWTKEESGEESDAPNWDDFSQLDSIIVEALTRSGFYRKGTPATMPNIVKRLFRRLNPDEREMQILLGIFGRINRTLSGKCPPYPWEE